MYEGDGVLRTVGTLPGRDRGQHRAQVFDDDAPRRCGTVPPLSWIHKGTSWPGLRLDDPLHRPSVPDNSVQIDAVSITVGWRLQGVRRGARSALHDVDGQAPLGRSPCTWPACPDPSRGIVAMTLSRLTMCELSPRSAVRAAATALTDAIALRSMHGIRTRPPTGSQVRPRLRVWRRSRRRSRLAPASCRGRWLSPRPPWSRLSPPRPDSPPQPPRWTPGVLEDHPDGGRRQQEGRHTLVVRPGTKCQ